MSFEKKETCAHAKENPTEKLLNLEPRNLDKIESELFLKLIYFLFFLF